MEEVKEKLERMKKDKAQPKEDTTPDTHCQMEESSECFCFRYDQTEADVKEEDKKKSKGIWGR